MTNSELPAKPEDDLNAQDSPDRPELSFLARLAARIKRRRRDAAAKRKAMLTECGHTLTPDQRALKIGFGIVFEALTLLLGLLFLWFNAIFFFLQNERVELSPLKPSAALWFTEKFDGQSADLESIEIQYRKESRGLALVAKNVVINDAAGVPLFTLPRLDSQFDLADMIFGRFVPRRTQVEGGAVTVKFVENGDVQFGLGSPESFEHLDADFTFRKTQEPPNTTSDWRNIEQVSLKDVSVYTVNTYTDVTHHFVGVTGEYTYEEQVLTATVDGALRADIPVPFKINFDTDDSFELVRLKLAVEGLNPAALNAQYGAMPKFAALNAPVDGRIDLTLGEGSTLLGLGVEISAGEGQWMSKGKPAQFEAAGLNADYDVASGEIDIKSVRLASKRLAFRGQGQISGAENDAPLGLKNAFNLKLDLSDFTAEPGRGFEGVYKARNAGLTALIDPAFLEADITRFTAQTDAFTLDLSGKVTGDDKSGTLKLARADLEGTAIGALTERDVLKYWPSTLAPMSRDWVKSSILRADVSRIDMQVNLTPESLARGYLLNDEFVFAFPVRNADVKFISTMTPMTNAAGSGVLRGNSFSIGVDTAKLGEQISVFDSRVDITRFVPIGADLNVTVNAQGPITPLLEFIDEPPFGYATRFGLDPAAFSGGGIVNYEFSRPVGMPGRSDLMRHTVNADFANITAPIKIGPHAVNNGQLKFELDARGLKLYGPVNVGPWPAQFALTDSFEDGAGNAEHRLTGTLSRDDFDRLGLGFREYITGDIDVTILAEGDGLSVDGASVSADLSAADLRFDDIWTKPAGQPGQLSARLSKDGTGGAQISDIILNAGGLDVQGGAKFGSDLRLLSLNLPVTKIDGFIDSAVIASTPKAGELALTMRGDYLNLEPWVAAALSQDAQAGAFPLGLSGEFSRLNLRNGFMIADAKIGLKNSDAGLTSLILSGNQDAKPLSMSLTSSANGQRDLVLRLPDAGAVMADVLELKNIEGGALKINARLPAPGAPGPMIGTAVVDDFKLVDAPVFARILTLASLSGLGEILSGDGMNFEMLSAPFTYEEELLRLKDARASGPSMGITASGDIDFGEKTLDVDGVLVPAYTLNSVLGDIPLLGDIVVGKKGEGMFALNYSVDGSFQKTQVAVNPLSAFAPGFLRRIFDRPADVPAINDGKVPAQP